MAGEEKPLSDAVTVCSTSSWLVQTTVVPAGTVIVFDVTGPGGALRSITFDGERGRAGATVHAEPASTLRLDLPTLTVLACGRSDDPGARSRVIVEGDQNLARLVLEDMAVTP